MATYTARTDKIFAEAAGLSVVPGSIHKRPPPEPDIFCHLEGMGPRAFELVELVEERLANRVRSQPVFRNELQRAYDECSDRFLEGKYVSVFPVEGLSKAARRQTIPVILDALRSAGADFEGDVPITSQSPLAGVLKPQGLAVHNVSIPGLNFDVCWPGNPHDPPLGVVEQKLARTDYEPRAPMELVAYLNSHPLPPGPWLSAMRQLVTRRIERSAFQAFWLCDLPASKVLLEARRQNEIVR